MPAQLAKTATINRLQKEILSLQGGSIVEGSQYVPFGLGPLEKAFPQQTFPTAAVHEFISADGAAAASTSGFISGLLQHFLKSTLSGPCLWISTHRTLFPPALKAFGLSPERVVFIDLTTNRDALWVMEEALGCEGLAAVVCEASELSFTQSRRLQLAVETSRVTGFIHRYNPRAEGTNACVSRWRITPLDSALEEGLPGVGLPRWNVRLQKIRNGRPGTWHLEWTGNGFRHIPLFTPSISAASILQKVA
jgi:protein ImuA